MPSLNRIRSSRSSFPVRLRPAWDCVDIRKLKIGLGEQMPIQANFHCHRTPDQQEYDMHYELELGIVCSGRMRRLYQGFDQELTAGDAWFCGVWEPHGYRVACPPCEVMVFVIWPPLLVNLQMEETPGFNWMAPFTAAPRDRPRASLTARSLMTRMIQRLRVILPKTDPAHLIWRRLLLMEILMVLCEGWKSPRSLIHAPPDTCGRLNRAIELTFNCNHPVRVQDAAQTCGLSRNAFARMFQAFMGLGYAEFNLRHRLNGAAAHLRKSDIPIKAIASRWGFTDPSHFYRHFLHHYHCSPGEYRRRHQWSGM